MPLPSPSDSLKKQLDKVVIEEVSKLITSAGGKQSYTSSKSYHCKVCSRTFVSNSSSVIPAFSKAITPVTIHACAHACLTVVWQCPYILGFSSADTTRLDLTVKPLMFSSKLNLILYPRKFSAMNNLQYTVCISSVPVVFVVIYGTAQTQRRTHSRVALE